MVFVQISIIDNWCKLAMKGKFKWAHFALIEVYGQANMWNSAVLNPLNRL